MVSRGNSVLCMAVVGPRYARDNVYVELREVSVIDNNIPRGSVIFLVNSTLETNQVRTKRIYWYALRNRPLSSRCVSFLSAEQSHDGRRAWSVKLATRRAQRPTRNETSNSFLRAKSTDRSKRYSYTHPTTVIYQSKTWYVCLQWD